MNRSELQIRIDELADEFLELRRDGKKPTIQEFTQANPDIAAPLRDFLKTILMVDNFKKGAAGQLSADFTKSDGQSFPKINDYEIIRKIGRGGMGIVYEAQQLSLARTVALKVLSPGLYQNPNAQSRFQLEAMSAARLHHSNIIPIYDVGREQEHCYFAMQYIEGQSLDHVIEGLKAAGDAQEDSASVLSDTLKMGLSSTSAGRKPFYRNVAELGCAAAEALDYAHEKGVIHRDIKPTNLVLDMKGVVWIADFGLAKTGDSDLTQTGDVVGTQRYMSPERFSGRQDRRGDIYSLGMTIYELLARESAFNTNDRMSLIESIKSHEPTSLRKVDRQIPHDLATIVEKSIEKDPNRRYSTAGEMAADLQRFCSGQPIFARRVGNQ